MIVEETGLNKNAVHSILTRCYVANPYIGKSVHLLLGQTMYTWSTDKMCAVLSLLHKVYRQPPTANKLKRLALLVAVRQQPSSHTVSSCCGCSVAMCVSLLCSISSPSPYCHRMAPALHYKQQGTDEFLDSDRSFISAFDLYIFIYKLELV